MLKREEVFIMLNFHWICFEPKNSVELLQGGALANPDDECRLHPPRRLGRRQGPGLQKSFEHLRKAFSSQSSNTALEFYK